MTKAKMPNAVQLLRLRNYINEQVRHVTCSLCYNYYIVPETATCGHSLCHTCWTGQRVCPLCTHQLNRKDLKLNMPLKLLTENINALNDAFAQHFNIKLDELVFKNNDLVDKDCTKNVKDWLTNSQNHFSEQLSQETNYTQNDKAVVSKVQIHKGKKKAASPVKVLCKSISQDNWDMIEVMPETEDGKIQENVIGPKDIEPFFVDENEYSTDNPRRSSRKRKIKNKDSDNDKSKDYIETKNDKNTTNSSNTTKLNKKENWNNVKKMKKEFSKLSKRNNKLNVSIEACKNIQSLSSKLNVMATSTLLQVVNTNENIKNNKQTVEEGIKQSVLLDKKQNEISDTLLGQPGREKETVSVQREFLHNSINDEDDNVIIIENTDNIQTKIQDISHTEDNNHKHISKDKPLKMQFIKKSALCPKRDDTDYRSDIIDAVINNNEPNPTTKDSDDVEISIKTGNTVTNIIIKKRENDIHFRVMTDQGVQTSLLPYEPKDNNEALFTLKNIAGQNLNLNIGNNPESIIEIRSKTYENSNEGYKKPISETISPKKNTASAETKTVDTVQCDIITESVEKELANVMECSKEVRQEANDREIYVETDPVEPENKAVDKEIENVELGHDFDIFDTESVKESERVVLKQTPSEILIPTIGSKKFKDEKNAEKRQREKNSEESLPTTKKIKLTVEQENEKKEDNVPKTNNVRDSDSVHYDTLMSQVFANIDEELEGIRKSQYFKNKDDVKTVNETPHTQKTNTLHSGQKGKNTKNTDDIEYDFSFLDKQNWEEHQNLEVALSVHRLDQLTPATTQKSKSTKSQDEIIKKTGTEVITVHDHDDSDRSVVEETPEKNVSFPRLKQQKSNSAIKELTDINVVTEIVVNKPVDSEQVKSVISLSDSISQKSFQDISVVENSCKLTLETPLSINKFVGSITHKSTPVARKTLNFDSENIEDPEQTLCPTSDNAENVAKTTQEKEFMMKVFEKTPEVVRPLMNKSMKEKKYYIAGSCLSSTELIKLKILCEQQNWIYLDKYTNDITHLVVGVDAENKSQRSVKYMCALAASKWIVTYSWVEKCLTTRKILNEEYFEALDSTGEPGPRRSRIASQKLFKGFTFYCMPPFSVLDVDTLKLMLESSGGQVVDDVQKVRVTKDTHEPVLLLAEPENTQEDRFIYLAMELSIVPVNYEWVLNCLGSYTLESVHELLLCPSTLLPAGTAKWPGSLLARDDD